MSKSEQPIYRIEDIEFDPSQGSLRRDDEEYFLRPQVLQLLLYLIRQQQRTVSKDELIEQVWDGAAVTDSALVNCIVEIRKALGDDSHHPRFVKTIPKLGYRFIGKVEELAAGGAADIATREVTTLELEYVEEKDEDNGSARNELTGIRQPPLTATSAHIPTFARSHPRVALMVAVVMIAAIGLGIYLVARNARPEAPQTALTLPQVPGKKPVAVMYFENQSGDAELDWLREGLADMLITSLSRSKKLTVLSRQQLHLVLERTDRAAAQRIRLDEALVVARKSRAEAIVLGSFSRLGEKVRLDIRIHDANDGQLLAAESSVADRPGQILTQVDILSHKLAAHLGEPFAEQETRSGLTRAMTDNLDAYRYYSLGVQKARSLENAEAIELFEKAIAIDPEFAMAHARIGYVYAVTWGYPTGFAEKARTYLEKAYQLPDRLTEKDRLYITGWYAIAHLDYPDAIRIFREILTHYPLDIEACHRLAYLLLGEMKYEEGIDVLRQGLAVDPEATRLYNTLGGVYSHLGRHDEAIAVRRQYVQLAPLEPNAHDSLGLSYQWAGRYDEAIAEYNQALALNPEFEIAIIHLGNVYFQLGRYRQAIARYRRYIQAAPSNGELARGYGALGLVYWKKGEARQAEEAARMAIKYDQNAIATLLDIALDRGQLATSEKLADHFFANYYSGRGMRTTRRPAHYYRGRLALKQGRETEAIEHFKEALRQGPLIWDPDPLEDCLATAYLQLGRLDEAIAEFERILKLNPKYPLVQYHLGLAHERKGESEQARAAFARFLKIWNDTDQDIPEVIKAKSRLAG